MIAEFVTIMMLGDPVGQGRPRFSRKSGVAYTPAETRNVSAALRILAQQEMRGRERFVEPVSLELYAECPIPASWSRPKQQRALSGELSPGRPDLSNIVKLAEDALNGVVYRDDALIQTISARKRYGVQPKIVVTISPSPEPAGERNPRHVVNHWGGESSQYSKFPIAENGRQEDFPSRTSFAASIASTTAPNNSP